MFLVFGAFKWINGGVYVKIENFNGVSIDYVVFKVVNGDM